MSNIENNNNRNKYISQHLVISESWPIDAVIEDPEFFFRSLTRTQRDLIEHLIRLSLRYKNVYPRQDTLASYLKISREHCNRLIKWMKDHGLLVSEYRHKLSCHYTLSPFFFNEAMQSRLKHIFRPLRAFSLGLLCAFSSEITQYIDKLNVNLTNIIVQRQTASSMKQFSQTYHDDKPVSVAIRELTCIKLTRAGQIKLSAFPDEAILDAANAFKYAKNVREPYNWFYKLCFDYCKRNEIDPDWNFMHELIEKYKVSLTSPMVQPKSATSRDETSRTNSKNRVTNQRNGRSAEQAVPINATSSEFRKKTEWNGHVEMERPKVDKNALRNNLLTMIDNKNLFALSVMKNYPFEVQKDMLDLLASKDSCYCEKMNTLCSWSQNCTH